MRAQPTKNTSPNPDKADWDKVNAKLSAQDKMRLIREKKCLRCQTPGHTFKECNKRKNHAPIRTAA